MIKHPKTKITIINKKNTENRMMKRALSLNTNIFWKKETTQKHKDHQYIFIHKIILKKLSHNSKVSMKKYPSKPKIKI
jgi:hypothetical protein